MGWNILLHGSRLTTSTRQLEGGQQDATQPRPVPTGAGTADWNRSWNHRLEPHAQLQKLELELEEGGRVRATKVGNAAPPPLGTVD